MSHTASPTTSHTSLRRSISNTLKGSAGNLVEWYDVYVYSVFATYFESQFFDANDKNSTIYVWAIFAVTFLMNPIGSWFFGRFADRHGRKRSLTVAVTLMTVCSFVIAVVPTADMIGVGAPIILVLCRLLQGFAAGGEYGASATYMAETAVPGRRGLLVSFHYVTLIGGLVLARATLLVMVLALDHQEISEWGWRIAFGIGGVAALVVFWLRRTMDESLPEEKLNATKSGGAKTTGSMRELLTHQWRPLLLCILVTLAGTIVFYTYSVTAPGIVEATFKHDSTALGSIVNLIALLIFALLQPVGGWLSDIVGRKTLLVFFGVGSLLYTWVPLLLLPQQSNAFISFAILLGGFIILTGYASINTLVKAELFPAHIRALGVGFGYTLASSLFGGTSPLLYQAAKAAQQIPLFIVYATVLVTISLITYVFFLKNHGRTWLDRDQDASEERGTRSRARLTSASANPITASENPTHPGAR